MSKFHALKILIIGSLFASSSVIAATTGSVTLGGTVASSLSVVSAPTTGVGGASDLDLSGGQKIVKVSDIAMGTNNEAGLTLTASSGDITKTDATSIAYQTTSVANAATAPVAGAFAIPSGSDYTVGTIGSGSTDVDLYIMYTPLALQDPGIYGGSISLTVTDN